MDDLSIKLKVNLTDSEWDAIQEAAQTEGVSMADYIKHWIWPRAYEKSLEELWTS